MANKKRKTKRRTQTKESYKDIAQRASVKIGQLIKNGRIKKGLSQGDLAEQLKYESPQYISDWERAYSSVPLSKLVELAEILDLNSDHLFSLFLDFAVEQLSQDMRHEYAVAKKRSGTN